MTVGEQCRTEAVAAAPGLGNLAARPTFRPLRAGEHAPGGANGDEASGLGPVDAESNLARAGGDARDPRPRLGEWHEDAAEALEQRRPDVPGDFPQRLARAARE